MPKYYCDYCDTYLTHDSPSVRKTHCQGRKHKDNVKFYYQKWMEEQAQHLIDATTAAFKAGKIASNPFAGGNPGGGGGGVSIPPPSNMNPGPRPMPPPMMGPMGPMGPMGLMMGPHGPMQMHMMQMHGPRGPPMHPMMHQMQQMGGPPNMRAPPLLAGPIGIKK